MDWIKPGAKGRVLTGQYEGDKVEVLKGPWTSSTGNVLCSVRLLSGKGKKNMFTHRIKPLDERDPNIAFLYRDR